MPYLVATNGASIWPWGNGVFTWANPTSTATWGSMNSTEATNQIWQGRQERQERRDRARVRARQTLLALLSPDNQRRLNQEGYIHVTGSVGGWYRIYANSFAQNVFTLSADGNEGLRLCAHPPMHDDQGEPLPIDDAVIAQMLALVADEVSFLRVANVG